MPSIKDGRLTAAPSHSGNFAWGSEHITAKTRVLGVVFNASNNELVRTNTLVKGAVIQVDATPFRVAYEKHYGKPVTTKRRAAGQGAAEVEADTKKSGHVEKKLAARQKDSSLDPLVEQQFGSGRLYACISESSSEEEMRKVIFADEIPFLRRLATRPERTMRRIHSRRT